MHSGPIASVVTGKCWPYSNNTESKLCEIPMTTANTARVLDIAVMPGDGIGPEVIDATVPLLEKLAHDAPYAFRFASHPAGAQHYKATGIALPPETLAAARAADTTLFGAMGWPEIRYPDGTEIAPQLELRVELGLYAGVRPARAIPGVPLSLPFIR
jgi:3-isopropylmalate dehydrogenase